ncbi:MAG: GntR family transcriptional regulator [Cyclobacteriaceae bacterium]|nr:GntR family transcriptional regulator [Cyclobacteriaceae bacterium]
MEFSESKNIFLQIEEWLNNRILEKKIQPGERIPSVRELAEDMEVNRNTVMRSYSEMESKGIIENKRGIGFFVADEAPQIIHAIQKREFFDKELPRLMERVKLLQLKSTDLSELINLIKKNDHENKN